MTFLRQALALVLIALMATPALPQTNIGSVTTTRINNVYNANNAGGADIGAKVNSVVATIGSGTQGVIEVQPGDQTASTLITLGKKHELRIRGKGTFTAIIRFADSTTDLTGLGAITCPEGATIKLPNGANTDVISQTNFASLTGTMSSYGMFRPVIRGCTIDGNKANNTAGYAIRLYASGPVIDHVQVQNAFQDGIYTEWGNDLPAGGSCPPTCNDNIDMSGWFNHVRSVSNGGNGWTHYGPHDSQFVAINVVGNAGKGWVDGSAASGQAGNGNGSHIWNLNAYDNGGTAFHTRLGVIAEDIAVSGPGGQIGILLDTVAGPSTMTNITGAGGIGLECRNGSQNYISGIVENNTTDGLKLNSCANSKFDLVFANSPNAINFVGDNGANQIFANVANGVGQVVTGNIGSMSVGTTLLLDCNSSSTGCFGAGTAHKIQFAGSALGTKVAMLDATGNFTGAQTFSGNLTVASTSVFSVLDNYLILKNTSPGAANYGIIFGNGAGTNRWGLFTSVAEGGANSGSNLVLNNYSDAGAFINTVLSVTRSSGAFAFNTPFTSNGISTFVSDLYVKNGANGYTRFVQSVNNNLPYMEWRTGAGTRLAYLGNGGTNFDINLENSAKFAVNGGSITADSQFISTLATGTAPFSVASTTNVPNLNASSLSGATMAAPGAIGGGTPNTGAFTTISATGQITSTVSTGTAPFSIASTTNVPNLNASSLSGATMASPGAIGGTAANTINATSYTVNGLARTFFVTADFTTAANTNLQAITGLTWTLPANIAQNIPIRCHFAYAQGTAVAAVSFGFQSVTVSPTQFNATGDIYTSATAVTAGNLQGLNTTTATAIVTATPSAITTIWNADIYGMLEYPSNASTSVINIMVKTATAGDAVTIKRGSYCSVF